jgi:hypothetical protein
LNSEKIWKIQKKSKLNSGKYGNYGRKISWIVKRFGKYKENCEMRWKIYFPYLFITTKVTFLPYFPYLFTIQLIFLPYFPNLITIQLPFLPCFPSLFTIQLGFLE